MEDVLASQGITREAFTASCAGLEPDEVAYREAKLIALALNEGTEMKTADTDQTKYFPWFWVKPDEQAPAGFGLSCGGCAYSAAYAHRGARLAFKSSELAQYAGEQFTDVYVRFFS